MPRAICCKASLRRCKGGASAKAACSGGASRRFWEEASIRRVLSWPPQRSARALRDCRSPGRFFVRLCVLYGNDRPPIMAYMSLRQAGPMRISATLPLSMSRALFRRPEQRLLFGPIRYLCLGRFGVLPAAVLPAVVAASACRRALAVFAWLPFFFLRRADSVSEGAKRENLSCDKRPAMRTVCHRAFYIILLYHILFKRFCRV